MLLKLLYVRTIIVDLVRRAIHRKEGNFQGLALTGGSSRLSIFLDSLSEGGLRDNIAVPTAAILMCYSRLPKDIMAVPIRTSINFILIL